jgi:hypothetical protein
VTAISGINTRFIKETSAPSVSDSLHRLAGSRQIEIGSGKLPFEFAGAQKLLHYLYQLSQAIPQTTLKFCLDGAR